MKTFGLKANKPRQLMISSCYVHVICAIYDLLSLVPSYQQLHLFDDECIHFKMEKVLGRTILTSIIIIPNL